MVREKYFNIKVSNSFKEIINNTYSKYSHIKKNMFYLKLLDYGIKTINSIPNIQNYIEATQDKNISIFFYGQENHYKIIDELHKNYKFIKKNDFIEALLRIGLEYLINRNTLE